MHPKRVWKYFGIKNLGEYRDLYLESDTSLLAVFGNFRKTFLKNYRLNSAKFLSTSIPMASSFAKN